MRTLVFPRGVYWIVGLIVLAVALISAVASEPLGVFLVGVGIPIAFFALAFVLLRAALRGR